MSSGQLVTDSACEKPKRGNSVHFLRVGNETGYDFESKSFIS
ncbi:unnamed protein product [Amoebophrya sp. A25]|nr:unnamed protein product [Amoebophrya sp. A25]|eukprot:GSA25T00009839001.1